MKHLERAAKSLRKGDDEAALEALLEAWREKRSVRIADAIDRVAARLPHEPVPGKTVKARSEAWLALAKKKRAVDLGSLLATPWPGKWQDAMTVQAALARFPSDPRVAMAFTRVIEAMPYDSIQSRRFYWQLIMRLEELLDRRTLPLLEKDLERTKSRNWRESVRAFVVNAVEAIRASTDATLTKSEDVALAEVEAFFAGDKQNEQAKAKGEAEFLAAIYGAPDDDSVRMVFADWLQERGDPRGELIALQLAPPTPTSRKRVAALLKKHGTAWAGPLHRFLAKDDRVFERGFLAQGKLTLEGRPKTLPPDLDQSAWATVHGLTLDWYVSHDEHALAVLALPCFRHLRRIGACFEADVAALPPRPLIVDLEMQLVSQYSETPAILEARRRFAEGKTFPALRRLGVEGEVDRLALLLGGALGKRLERITLFNTELPLGPFVRLLDSLGLRPEEARVIYRLHTKETPWRLTLRRDAKGALTVLHGVAENRASLLEGALESLEPNELTAITIDTRSPCRYDEDDVDRLEAQLARFEKLAVAVPWRKT